MVSINTGRQGRQHLPRGTRAFAVLVSMTFIALGLATITPATAASSSLLPTTVTVLNTPLSPGTIQVGQGVTGTASATLHPINNSGISGILRFEQDPLQMRVTGSASGFVPNRQYVSLVYGNKTVATGPSACGRDDTLNFEQMLLSEWLPIDSTIRTLRPVSKLTVNLGQVNTASIRMVDAPLLPDINKDIPPQLFVLRSCGLIVR